MSKDLTGVKTEKLGGHLSVAAAYAIFGLNIVFCKDIANSEVISPIVLFTLRAVGASLLFWLISLFLPKEKVAKADLPKIAAASLAGLFVPQLTFLMAITMTTSIDTAIMSTLGPIFTMFFAFFFQKEPITFKKAGGVALSFAGVLYLIFNSVHGGGAETTAPMGIALLLLNSLSFALYLGLFRPLISRYSVVAFMKWMFLFALLISLPFSTRGLIHTDFAAIPADVRWEIAYLIVFATFVAYFLIPYGQKRIRPTLVSMYTYLQPIIAAIVSIWTGLDTLSWQKVAATVLIVGGVILVSRSRAATKTSAASGSTGSAADANNL
jgi:drug/metabolite transporter (DMT)-like permease